MSQLLHCNWRYDSETSIQHHCWLQCVGMSLYAQQKCKVHFLSTQTNGGEGTVSCQIALFIVYVKLVCHLYWMVASAADSMRVSIYNWEKKMLIIYCVNGHPHITQRAREDYITFEATLNSRLVSISENRSFLDFTMSRAKSHFVHCLWRLCWKLRFWIFFFINLVAKS